MKRNATETAETPVAGEMPAKANDHKALLNGELSLILEGLQTVRNGDFSVRLPGSWTGLAGKIADTFNEIVTANEQMARELKRLGQVVGKQGRTRRSDF